MRQAQLAGFRVPGGEGLEQSLQVEDQQQGAATLGIGGGLERGRAIDQPALADLVGFRRRVGAAFGAGDQVQSREIQRRGAVIARLGLAGQVELRVHQAVGEAQAGFRSLDLVGVLALQGLEQRRVKGRRLGLGDQVVGRLAQACGRHGAGGLRQAAAQRLVPGANHAKPQERGGQGQPTEGKLQPW